MSSFRISREPSLEAFIYTALAAQRSPQEFCRELYFGGLGQAKIINVCILAFDSKSQLRTLGSFPPPATATDAIGPGFLGLAIDEYALESFKTENREFVRTYDLETDGHFCSLTAVPSYLTHKTNGVLVILSSGTAKTPALGKAEFLALALACELYCSDGVGNFRKIKTNSTSLSEPRSGVESLSQRQLEILAMIKEGNTNESIARRLKYSLATIKKEISIIFTLLGVNNREAAASAIPGVGEVLAADGVCFPVSQISHL